MAIDCTVEVRRDKRPTIRFVAENTGTDPIDLDFTDGQTIEVVVERDGAEQWRYSDGQLFTQALRTETLQPGERLVETVSEVSLPEGTVRAWLCTADTDCTATA